MLRVAVMTVGLVVAAPAAAQAERFDHQGSIFAVVAPGAAYHVGTANFVHNGGRWCALVGGGMATQLERVEFLFLGRATGRTDALEVSALAGVRTTFLGGERWGTFADVQLALELYPAPTLGPRFAVGAQFEIAPVAGVFCSAGAMAGVGPGSNLLGTADVSCGLQLRTYVL